MNLARLLQPAMVVIEDVDLIARIASRCAPCDETMLNSLLNEMDGLKENSDILFILTTNRPQDLEAALANRPGRIDQAIEVPVPTTRPRQAGPPLRQRPEARRRAGAKPCSAPTASAPPSSRN